MNEVDYQKINRHVFKELKKLSKKLYYHGIHHTKDVLKVAERITKLEKVSGKELLILKTAVLFHDVGFLKKYKNNESIGVKVAQKTLPKYNYSKKEIETISNMILATKIPQKPKTKYEKIICDADLDNFGRKDFFKKTEDVRKELFYQGVKIPKKDWLKQVLKLLENHRYFTKGARKLRNKGKEKNIKKIKYMLKK